MTRRLLPLALAALLALAAPAAAAPVFEERGIWTLEVYDGRCVASARALDRHIFEFNALEGEVGFAVFAPDGPPIPRGRNGRLLADEHGYDFKPAFMVGAVYVAEPLDAATVAAIRRADLVQVLVDDKAVIKMDVTDTGLAQVIDALVDCSNGKAGWWGEGLKPEPSSERRPS